MSNLSQQKRQRMLEFLHAIREEHKDDDNMLIAIGEIESELNAKKYGLVWEQHEESVDVQMQDNIPVFTEYKEREISMDSDGVYNFILEGDNLHSLRLLEKTHSNAIDLIFIDPPYNTGHNDFIYADSFVDIQDSYRHSKWCSFMKSRLLPAKELLKETGCIFISIDDNEFADLKFICDEIFGESNFITCCMWQKIHSIKNDAKYISVNHDYIFVYARDINKLSLHLLDRTEAMDGRYKNPDNDPRGPWQSGDLVANQVRTNGNYDVVGPTGKVFNVPQGKHWVYSEDNMKTLVAENRIWFGKNGTSFPRKKRYLSEVQQGRTPDTWWTSSEVGHNQEGARELKAIFDEKVVFTNPKPTRLISRIIQMATDDNGLILDFFAGSGTTAHAVLKYNKEHPDSHRHFILCTNNENNICEEVTYERIKRVINGYSDVPGIPANLKYYRTDFIPKNTDDVSEALLSHVAEMIQLEHGVKIDGNNYIMVMNDVDADILEKHWDEHKNVKALYISKNVLLTTKQNKLFSVVEQHIIPDDYFKFELQEVGESW